MASSGLTFARVIGTTVILLAAPARPGGGAEIDGFTIPYRLVKVATAETGVVSKVLVREGDKVQQGQPLAKLEDRVHATLLAMAEQAMGMQGRVNGAEAEVRLRQERFTKLTELLTRGSARPEEVERAQVDLVIAEGQLLTIREELLMKELEHQRAKIQWERRTIRAPISGIVTRLSKEEGEFIGPNDPHLLTIVQLDPLLAVFSMPSQSARRLQQGQKARLRLDETKEVAGGTIELISPIVDGKSGTVRVKVRIENSDGKYHSGEQCTLLTGRGGGQNLSTTGISGNSGHSD